MKVFVVLITTFALTVAYPHHTEKHLEIDNTDDETQTTETKTPTITDALESRHHVATQGLQATAVPVLIPYPVSRSQALPSQYSNLPNIQYLPVYQEHPAARQGVGGGLSANVGPFSGGVGAGVGTGGLGGGFNVGAGNFGGLNANFGFTPSTVITPNPGYTGYYNQYYTPVTYYTAASAPTNTYNTVPTVYPVSSLAASSPSTHFARSPQHGGLLMPMYY